MEAKRLPYEIMHKYSASNSGGKDDEVRGRRVVRGRSFGFLA